MSVITDVLDACGITYKHNGYMPKKPPDSPFYAAVFEAREAVGSDHEVMAYRVSPLVELYDDGGSAGAAKRAELSEALSCANVKHRMHHTTYLYSVKKHLTVYDCEDYFEKRSEQ